MSFAEPRWLWGLIPLVLLVLVFRWRRRRRRISLATFLLMERAMTGEEVSQRGRMFALNDLPLLVPAALLLLALADPWVARGKGEQLVILDRSVSMGTVADGRSRLARGRELLELSDVTWERLVGVPSPFDDAYLWQAEATVGSLDDLLRAIESAVPEHESIVVVTDYPRPGGLASSVEWLPVLEENPVPNHGILSVNSDASGAVVVTVCSQGSVDSELVLELEGTFGTPSQEILRTHLPLSSSVHRIRHQLPDPTPDVRVVARLSEDGNPLDNRLVGMTVTAAFRVKLPTLGFDPLARAFSSIPGVQVFRGEGPADLIVGQEDSSTAPRLLLQDGESNRVVTGKVEFRRAGSWRPVGEETRFPLVRMNGETGLAEEGVVVRIGGQPLLYRQGTDWVLGLAEIPASWESEPTFPLVMLELVSRLRSIDATPTATWSELRARMAEITGAHPVQELDEGIVGEAKVLSHDSLRWPLATLAIAFLFAASAFGNLVRARPKRVG